MAKTRLVIVVCTSLLLSGLEYLTLLDHKLKFSQQSELAPCGDVCGYKGQLVDNESKKPRLWKHINCDNIMRRMAYRNYNIEYPPPRYPPLDLVSEFTMDGQMPITSYLYFKPLARNTSGEYNASYIGHLIDKVNKGLAVNSYAAGLCVENTISKYQDEIKGKRGLVVGTMRPWLEAILLAFGAGSVTTLEYAKLKLDHKQLESVTPYDFADKYLRGEVDQFDFGATFSSLEHSGLGRYTDPLNPFGDLEAMAQIWCMIKPGGLFVLGLPCSKSGQGYIVWNAHRFYGKKRLLQMTANWSLLRVSKCKDYHSLLVLRRAPFRVTVSDVEFTV